MMPALVAISLLSVFVMGQVSTHGIGKTLVIPSEQFTGSVALVNDDRYHLFWNSDSTSITFEVHVRARGWVGLGLSPNGGMTYSDMVIGWVKDGRTYFQDRYATGNTMPVVDTSQDWVILEGRETDSHTILKFKRPLYSCDSQDRNVTRGTIRLVYAYSDIDPSSEDSINYHQSTRGQKSIAFFTSQVNDPEPPQNAIYRDFRNHNVTIPHHTHTTYWCQGFNAPDFKGQKHHIIKVEPIITPGNEGTVHHILLYACYHEPQGVKDLPEQGFRCFVPNMPWGECIAVIAGWAIGGKSFDFPDHVGFPVGEAGGIRYLRLETHYDNTAYAKGVRDFSGLRLWFTSTLRKYDSGLLEAGIQVTALGHILPAGYSSLSCLGLCSKECLSEGMGSEPGINVFGSLLHTHLLGTGVRVHHYRNGVEEPYLDQDMTYDFNYQNMRVIEPEVKIMKGDNLVVECRYNTTEKKSATFGGLGTDQEMCIAYLVYYPRINVIVCNAVPTQANMAKALNFKYRTETKFIPPHHYGEWAVITEGPYTNMTFTEYINMTHAFPNDTYMKRYQRSITTGNMIQKCRYGVHRLDAHNVVTQMPIVTEPYIPDTQPCGSVVDPDASTLPPTGACTRPASASGLLLLLPAILICMVF